MPGVAMRGDASWPGGPAGHSPGVPERPPASRAADFHLVARAGYAARGAIYLIVGGLAAVAATGRGGATPGSRGALSELLGAPFGKFTLAAVAAGLVGYAGWRTVQAVYDTDRHGKDAGGIVVRVSLAVSAILHLGLAFFALSLILGWGTGGDSGHEWTAWLLGRPFGPWLVAAAGAAVIAAGLAHWVKAWKAGFERYFIMNARERSIITPIGRVGLFARGLAFLMIGAFFIVAAVQHDPSEARGLSGALQTLQQQPNGWLPLAILAFGLAAFGVYSLIESVYRRVTFD